MKITILTFALTLVSASLPAQTNIYVSEPMIFSGKNHITCSANNFWQFGAEPVVKQRSGTSFTTATNVLTVSATNSLLMVDAGDLIGNVDICGKGSITFTDPYFPTNGWRFTVRWPTNKSLPFPTNKNVPVITVGFNEPTNSP